MSYEEPSSMNKMNKMNKMSMDKKLRQDQAAGQLAEREDSGKAELR